MWKFCNLCGGKLEIKGQYAWQCMQCGQSLYQNTAAASEASIINDKNELLVVTRAREPYKGSYDLPGGFIDIGETPEKALLRELGEELSLKPENILEMKYLAGGTSPYPWGKDTTYVMSLNFLVRINSEAVLKPQDDVAKVDWIPLKDIQADLFAFEAQQTQVIPLLKARF